MALSPEPSTAQEKVTYLKHFKVFQRRWFTIKYGYSDTNYISLHALILWVKEERVPLLELAHLETIKQLELDGWDEPTAIDCLLNRRFSSLVVVKLTRLHTPLSEPVAKRDLRCMNVKQPHVEFGSELFMSLLINFGVQTAHQMYFRPLTPISPFSDQQQQALRLAVEPTIPHAVDPGMLTNYTSHSILDGTRLCGA
ncbi:hypothetical protein BT69DRAFT_123649 [Atractiella rhizophila]|nr:hypothetical protein BT69DRAFT_123649 [Atractiella rhizophila]